MTHRCLVSSRSHALPPRILECVRHPESNPVSVRVTPHFLSANPCAPLLEFLSVDLPVLGSACKWNPTVCVCVCVRRLLWARKNPGGSQAPTTSSLVSGRRVSPPRTLVSLGRIPKLNELNSDPQETDPLFRRGCVNLKEPVSDQRAEGSPTG